MKFLRFMTGSVRQAVGDGLTTFLFWWSVISLLYDMRTPELFVRKVLEWLGVLGWFFDILYTAWGGARDALIFVTQPIFALLPVHLPEEIRASVSVGFFIGMRLWGPIINYAQYFRLRAFVLGLHKTEHDIVGERRKVLLRLAVLAVVMPILMWFVPMDITAKFDVSSADDSMKVMFSTFAAIGVGTLVSVLALFWRVRKWKAREFIANEKP